MERSLLWSAFALGWVGWLCALLLTYTQQIAAVVRPEAANEAVHNDNAQRAAGEVSSGHVRIPLSYLLTAVAVLLLVFLATLPTRPPFSPGQGWGRGFLLGGLGALLATWGILHIQHAAAQSDNAALRAASIAGPYFLAVAVTTTPLLLLPLTNVLIDPLVGIASGWFVTSFVLYFGVLMGNTDASSDQSLAQSSERPSTSTIVSAEFYVSTSQYVAMLALAAGAGFTVTLCAVTALGIYRNSLSHGFRNGTWSVIAVVFAVGIPLAILISALSSQLLQRALARTSLPRFIIAGWQAAISIIIVTGLGTMLSMKVVDQPKLSVIVVVGLLLGLVTSWLAGHASVPQPEQNQSESAAVTGMSPLASLVVLSASMVAFQLLQGFGVGIMVLAAWMVVGFALPALSSGEGNSKKSAASSLICLLLFGLMLVLYRLFSMRFRSDLQSANLSDHYALFGFLVGAILPTLLTQITGPSQSRIQILSAPATGGGQIARLILTGALALVVPGVIVVLWGAKCCLALLAGLAISIVSGQWSSATLQRYALNSALLALGVALVLVQWTHRVLPLAELSRVDRIRVLSYSIVGFIVLLLIVDYGGRLIMRLQQKRQFRPIPISTSSFK